MLVQFDNFSFTSSCCYLIFVCIACGDFVGRLLDWSGLDWFLLHVTFSCIRFRTPGVCGLALD